MVLNEETSELLEDTNKNIPTTSSSGSDVDAKSRMLDNKLSDMKKMMSKMYALQKRMINGDKVRFVH